MDDCPCFFASIDGCDELEACSETWRKARKAHTCCECGGAIAPGDLYQDTTGIWGGRPSRYRTCKGCVEVRLAFNCGGWIYGELWNDVRESGLIEAGSPPSACILRAVGEAGAEVLKQQWSREVEREAGR